MPTTPPALTPVLEFPATGDPAFNAKAFAWGTAERTTTAPEIAALAANAYANAIEGADSAAQAAISATTAATQVALATTQAGIATTQATNAGTSATQAAASAAIATNAANVQGTSTSSVAVPTANGQSRTFVYAESSRAIAVGMFVLVAVTASPNTNWMLLQVTGWTPGTNTLVGTVITYAGTGTFAAWTLSLSGPQGAQGSAASLSGTATGPVNFITGANIASASTINLNNRTGDRVHITGTTSITAVTLTNGPVTLVFDGALTLTHHANNNNLPGAANITTAAGDRAIYESDGTTVYCVDYAKADGTPVVTPPVSAPAFGAISSGTVLAAVSSPTFVATCAISATRAFVLCRNASNFPVVNLISNTGAVIATSAILNGNTVTEDSTPSIVRLNATDAVAIWSSVGTQPFAVVVRDAGASVTLGAVANLGLHSVCLRQCAVALSATKVVVGYQTGSAPIVAEARVLTVSGTTITPGTAQVLTSINSAFSLRCALVVAGNGGVVQFFGGAVSVHRSALATESAGNLTVSDAKVFRPPITFFQSLTSSQSSTGISDAVQAASNKVFLVTGTGLDNASSPNPFATVSTASLASGIMQADNNALLIDGPSDYTNRLGVGHRVRQHSASTFLHASAYYGGATLGSTDVSLTLNAYFLSGENISVAARSGRIGAASYFDFDIFPGTSTALVAYSDLANSNYTTIKTVALGTVA